MRASELNAPRPLARSVKGALRAMGYYRARVRWQAPAGVAVLAYHAIREDAWPAGAMNFENLHVTTSTLDRHCRCLRELGCTPLSLADWDAIAAGARPLPPRPVMITFDDGYRSVLRLGLPVLKRYNIPATVFVCTRPVERQLRFWFDAFAARHGEGAVEGAKELDHAEWARLTAACEMAAAGEDPHAPLTIDEVRELAADPSIGIGAHTATHPILARAPAQVQRQEIEESRTKLEAWIGRPVTAFAYPNGRRSRDYTEHTAALVSASGLRAAFSTDPAFALPGRAPFDHPRFLMLDDVDGTELAHRLAVAWPADRREDGPAPYPDRGNRARGVSSAR